MFSNGTTIAQNNSQLFWDDTNNRLGIGTASPGVTLDVNGSIRAISGTVFSSTTQTQAIQTNSSNLVIRGSGGTAYATLFQTTGNLVLQSGGTFTDAGYRLDVNGTARIQNHIYLASGFSYISLGNNVNLRSNIAGGAGYVVDAQSFNTLNGTNNEQGLGVFSGTYAPTSATGSPSFNGLKILPTINQTGGANGITRGLYINPTLTAAADFRAIETSNGKVIFGGTGNVLIGTTTDAGFKFDDNGTSMFRDTMNFRNTVNMDSAPLGSELATTASGTNWAGTSFATGYTHTTGSVVALTSATLTATGGNFYQIAITITGRTAGSINISIGAVSLLGITATSGYGIKASSTTTTLTVTPTTDFDGTVVLSVKQINTSTASMSWQTSAGTVVNEFRTSSSNNNLFFGTGAGQRNTTGTLNTFIGSLAGQSHTSGVSNVFVGFNAGLNTTTGNQNVFVGSYAGQGNVAGTQNTAMGYFSGSNVTGNNNSFYGAYTGQSATGSSNSFFGWQAGSANTSGGSNVCLGFQAGGNNLTGSTNVIIGNQAGRTISGGSTAATVINNSIIIGSNAYPLADNQTNQIVIGYNVVGLGSNTTVLGNSSTTFAAIYGNVGIGTTTDAGYKLDVNGTARVSGLTRSTDVFVVGGTATTNTANARFWSSGGQAPTSGLFRSFVSDIGWGPSSGTAEWNGVDLRPVMTQTGTATGITRGLYIAPVLTSVVDWRAIETTNGRVVISDTATVTGSNATSLLDLSQTWNTTGTPIAFKLNITDTASAALSDLMSLQVGGSARFRVLKSGFFIHNTGGEIVGNLVIGGNSIDASSQLEVRSLTKGFLPPRMTTTQKNAIASPASGLVVYDTTLGKLCVRGASAWETITSV